MATSGHRRRFRDYEPCPAVEKTTQRTVSVAHVNVLAASLRLHGTQLSVGKRTKERQQAAHEPCQINQFGRPHSLHHLGGNKKDSAADDRSHHHGGGVAHAKIAGEFRTVCAIWHERRLQVYVSGWELSWRERKFLTEEAPEVAAITSMLVQQSLLAYPTPNVTSAPTMTHHVHGMCVQRHRYRSTLNPKSMPNIAPRWLALRVNTPSRKTPSSAP